jgi:hypothetical protein
MKLIKQVSTRAATGSTLRLPIADFDCAWLYCHYKRNRKSLIILTSASARGLTGSSDLKQSAVRPSTAAQYQSRSLRLIVSSLSNLFSKLMRSGNTNVWESKANQDQLKYLLPFTRLFGARMGCE